jgi:hypothetical protein
MKQRVETLLLVLTAVAVMTACDEGLSELAGPTPDLEPTFSSIQRDVFQAADASGRVACASCHRTAALNFVGRLDLSTAAAYDQLVNVPSANKPGAIRVIPFDPENSYLIHKVEGRPGIFGNRMPNNGPPYLTSGQLLILKRWIEIGAPRN